MPSKNKRRGSPLVALRIPRDLLEVIDAKIESCNRTRRGEPYNRSSFIIASLRERFDKYIRSKEAAARKKAARAEQPHQVEQPAEQPGPADADQCGPVSIEQ